MKCKTQRLSEKTRIFSRNFYRYLVFHGPALYHAVPSRARHRRRDLDVSCVCSGPLVRHNSRASATMICARVAPWGATAFASWTSDAQCCNRQGSSESRKKKFFSWIHTTLFSLRPQAAFWSWRQAAEDRLCDSRLPIHKTRWPWNVRCAPNCCPGRLNSAWSAKTDFRSRNFYIEVANLGVVQLLEIRSIPGFRNFNIEG